MTLRRLRLGIALSDRVLPFLTGEVKPARIALDFDPADVDNLFWRALHSDDFDVTEMSLAAWCILCSRGERPFVGLPVVTSRMFRHGSIYVNAAAGIDRPQDLIGRRVGVPEYQMTLAVWMRGILAEFHGVAPDRVTWVRGGVDKPGRKERIDLRLPAHYRVEDAPDGDTLDRMLVEGRIDALMSPRIPPSFAAGDPRIRRLFADPRAAEEAYFRATGILPPMHMICLRRPVYEAEPWLAQAVFDAFAAAKRAAEMRLRDTDSPFCMVPWLESDIARAEAVLGRDFWPYGLAANRAALQRFIDYLGAQDLLAGPLAPEDLFAPDLLDS